MSTDNILVAIKSRPFISREKAAKLKPLWNAQDKAIFQIDDDGHRLGEPYSFDHVFTECHTNRNVYDAVVEPLVKSFLNGFNSTIFAYGQTSSGKTHTMMGTEETSGIIQMAINDVFQHVLNDSRRRYLISCSYFELYNEKINDLLDKNGQDLKIREDYCGNVFVNAKEEVVTQESQVYELMKVGSKIRKIGCTNMNERSSRSHTIFRLTIESTENSVENAPVQISQLNLVDLAGSERIAHTKAAGVRLKEGVNINKSLLALGNVIRQLSEGEGFINYRDSNITRLLQQALGGNAKSLIIATITAAAGEETRSTLEFAQRAKVVKNKPIINEILSEQDKLKQYELVTANYKNRLEKEKQRILEMEQEREQREREIIRLKQQVKLIDLFNKGPEVKKQESKIPRRHTMGHYTRVPLQTIPESRILSSNVMQEKELESDTKHDSDDEELLLKTSQLSDYDYMKLVVEETLDDCILAVTPEPPEESTVQEAGTPTHHLRERLRHLEESYMSLQEFTKLEAECKEEKNKMHELVTEKEKLLKDLIDLNIIIKDTRSEKEQIKVTLEDELTTLKNDLEVQKKENVKLAFALEQAEAEKETLKTEKKQMLTDNEVLFEQQKLKYEMQLQYFGAEIEQLNKQTEESRKINCSLEEEMKKLVKENETFKATITSYEEKIADLYEKLQDFEKTKEEDFEILSKLYILQDILSDANTEVQGVSTQTEQEVTENKEEMATLNEKLEYLHYVNSALEEKVRISMEKESLFSEMEASSNAMKNEIAEKADEISVLYNRVHILENEIENQKLEIENKKKDIQIRDMHISEFVNMVEILQNDIQESEKSIHKLLKQVHDLEELNDNQSTKIILYIEDLKATNRNVVNLHEQIAHLEMVNKMKEESILLSEQNIQSKDNDICDLLSKIEKLENCSEEIDSYKKEIECKTIEMAHLANQISEFEELKLSSIKMNEQVKYLQEEIEAKNQELRDHKNEIIKLTEKNQSLEKEDSQCVDKILELNGTIQNLEFDNGNKTQQISELTKKMEDLETLNTTKNERISELEIQIDYMKKSMQSNKEGFQMLQEDNEFKREEISKLRNCVQDLETVNETLNNKSVEKDLKISELSMKIVELKKESKKEDLFKILNEIARLEKKIKGLEEDNNKYKNGIKIKDRKISELEEELKLNATQINEQVKNLQEEIDAKNQELGYSQEEIIKLTEKNQTLEKEESDSADKILKLNSKIQNLEIEDGNKARQISELMKKMEDLENLNTTKNERISELEIEVDYMKKSVQSNKEEFQMLQDDNELKSEEISKLRNCVQDLETVNETLNKKSVEKDLKISELSMKIVELKKESNKEDLFRILNEIARLEKKLKVLEEDNNKYKNEIKIKDRKISELEEELKLNATQMNGQVKNLQEEIDAKNQELGYSKEEIIKLTEKNQTLEKEESDSADKILELNSKIQNLEIEDGNKARQISELMKKMEDLENLNITKSEHISELEIEVDYMKKSLQEDNELKSEEISKLRNRVQNLEKENKTQNKKVVERDMKISELSMKIVELKKESNKEDLFRIVNETARLEKKIKGLEEDNNKFKNEIKIRDRKILNLEVEIKYFELCDAKANDMEKTIAVMTREKEQDKKRNAELENSLKTAFMEITRLKSEIYELEQAIGVEKFGLPEHLETRNTRHSTTSSSSTDLSPKEIRRRKRQSIHDQRRGIDLSASAAGEMEEAMGPSSTTNSELEEKIKKLEAKIEDLTNENEALELEVQGFIGELDDYKKYFEEMGKDNDMLKMELEKVKKETGQQECKECTAKQGYIKNLKGLQKQNQFKIVELQTKIYDLHNSFKTDKSNWEEKERRLSFRISKLETQLGDQPLPELKDSKVQCDVLNYSSLLEKYENTKKIARMRREEGNILRARLGLSPDAPVQ